MEAEVKAARHVTNSKRVLEEAYETGNSGGLPPQATLCTQTKRLGGVTSAAVPSLDQSTSPGDNTHQYAPVPAASPWAGVDIVGAMSGQRERLKATHRKVLDVLNTIGGWVGGHGLAECTVRAVAGVWRPEGGRLEGAADRRRSAAEARRMCSWHAGWLRVVSQPSLPLPTTHPTHPPFPQASATLCCAWWSGVTGWTSCLCMGACWARCWLWRGSTGWSSCGSGGSTRRPHLSLYTLAATPLDWLPATLLPARWPAMPPPVTALAASGRLAGSAATRGISPCSCAAPRAPACLCPARVPHRKGFTAV